MKMFMDTLKEKVRSWHERLQPYSLYSLKDFHTTFFQYYEESHSSLSLF